MWLHFKLQFSLCIKFGSINHYPWEFNILQRTLTIWAWRNIAGNYRIHGQKNNLWVKKLYVSIEQAVFWLEVVCCLGKELGEEVAISHPISHPHKDFFCLDQWSLKRKQKFENWVENIYDAEFEISHGDRRNAASENQLASHSNVEYWIRHQN